MRRAILEESLVAVAVAGSLTAASMAGLPETLGAHPWWAQQSVIVGGVAGAVLWLVLRRAGVAFSRIAILSLLTLTASIVAAHFGKQAFVASFAENALAGRFWYFGWISLAGSLALFLCARGGILLNRDTK